MTRKEATEFVPASELTEVELPVTEIPATEPEAPVAKAKGKKPVAEVKVKKQSARKLFHEYLRGNDVAQLTDAEIFDRVASQLGWDEAGREKRKTYVKWYRSELRSLGEAITDPIEK